MAWEDVLNAIKGVDGFSRTDSTYLRRTTSGGVVSIITFGLLGILTLGEVYRFVYPPFKETFALDSTIGSNIDLELDVSVATECGKLVVFLADEAGRREMINESLALEEEDFEAISKKSMQGEEWVKQLQQTKSGLDSGTDAPLQGCRIRGKYPVNKAGGKLLILPFLSFLGTAGQFLEAQDNALNFSHYIHHFAFGPDYPSMRNPLNGASELAMKPKEHFKYFLSIITATYHDRLFGDHRVSTNQYAINGFLGENQELDSLNPGLFFAYSYEPLEKRILRDREPVVDFLIHLLGIIGGVYVTSGLIHRVLVKCWAAACRKFGWWRVAGSGKGFDAGWSPMAGHSGLETVMKQLVVEDPSGTFLP